MTAKQFGAMFATTVAGLMVSSALFAEGTTTTPAADKTKEAKPYCANNSCKGKSACNGHGNDSCSGKNSCKGHGWLEAKDEKACKKAGGLWKKA